VPPPRRIEVAPCPTADVARLEAELGCSHVIAQVLVRRGLGEPAAARAWLAADEAHPLAAFGGLDEAVALVRRHLEDGSRITIHGDYDVDGVCATAILVRALRALGAEVDWYLPSRTEDGYGLRAHTVARLAATGTKLLITADCAITAVEEVAAARAAGMDVLVTDHHAPRADGALPDAPIVHPGVCGYPFPELCAAAVAHKLAEALGAPTAAEDLDLVALATVADVVPLRGENRRLVREGLQALRTTRKPGLRALMDVTRCDAPRLDARAVGFRLAPRINAAGRLQRADAGLELVLTESPERALAVAEELDHVNAERRLVEQRMLFEAEAQVRAQLAGEAGLGAPDAAPLAAPDGVALAAPAAPPLALVVAGEGWHPGVAGIVASRLAERHHRPAVVIALDGDRGTGSARSIPAYDLLGGLNACAEHLLRHGGHRAAAGLEIEAAAIDAFRAALAAHAAATLTPEDLVPIQRVDAIVAGGDVGHALAEELARLEPFGHGNPDVTLLLPAARLADPRPMGEGRHVRFLVESGGTRARAVAFGCDGRLPVDDATPADVAVTLELNHYNGSVEPRLVLRHAQPCTPAPIAVLGEPEDYLAGAFAELTAPLSGAVPAPLRPAPLDRRDRGVAGTLASLVASGEPVLAVCADVPARLTGLRERLGGFALVSWAALEADPALARPYAHVVALDPPPWQAALAHATVLAWGGPELHFARQIHEREYRLRDPLAALYRALRDAGAAQDGRLVALLQGEDGPRSAPLAGRLLRVLHELELVELDVERRALRVPPARRTELERSTAFCAYERRLHEGLAWLSDRTAPAARAA
jgi:single-stranded-DNA-specific exonuclease